jgi:hypothetical protein
MLAAIVVDLRAVERADHQAPLVVTMTNDPAANAIRAYEVSTGQLVQTLSTRGRGGVAGNARGVRAFDDLVAAVNYGSNTVAVFRREGNHLALSQLVATTSAPVSIDFGNDHMYVAGTTTVDSFPLRHHRVDAIDGSTELQLVDGGVPPEGSTAQIGVRDHRSLLVTLKTDPDPGTVDIVSLDDDGAVRNVAPRAVSAPEGTLTPFGFSVYPDGTAVITLAHSNHDGLFRGSTFADVVAAGEGAPCWSTRIGKYIFTANTGSKSISRVVGTGNHVFVDAAVAASITSGGSPSDIDGADGVLGVLDRGAGQSHLSIFSYNAFGELTAAGGPISIGAPAANGVAILAAPR